MPSQTILHIRQTPASKDKHAIRLTLRRPGQADLEGEATVKFGLSDQEQEELRWYMEDYLQREEAVEPVTVEQVEALMRTRGEELYRLVLADALVLTTNVYTSALGFFKHQVMPVHALRQQPPALHPVRALPLDRRAGGDEVL